MNALYEDSKLIDNFVVLYRVSFVLSSLQHMCR